MASSAPVATAEERLVLALKRIDELEMCVARLEGKRCGGSEGGGGSLPEPLTKHQRYRQVHARDGTFKNTDCIVLDVPIKAMEDILYRDMVVITHVDINFYAYVARGQNGRVAAYGISMQSVDKGGDVLVMRPNISSWEGVLPSCCIKISELA